MSVSFKVTYKTRVVHYKTPQGTFKFVLTSCFLFLEWNGVSEHDHNKASFVREDAAVHTKNWFWNKSSWSSEMLASISWSLGRPWWLFIVINAFEQTLHLYGECWGWLHYTATAHCKCFKAILPVSLCSCTHKDAEHGLRGGEENCIYMTTPIIHSVSLQEWHESVFALTQTLAMVAENQMKHEHGEEAMDDSCKSNWFSSSPFKQLYS